MRGVSNYFRVALAFVVIFCGATKAIALDREDKRAKEILERLLTLRNWQLMEEFNIQGEKAQRVFEILSKYDKEREALILKRRHLMDSLKDAVEDDSSSEKELSQLLDKVTNVNIEIATIPKKELDGLKEVFNTRERARYLLFSQRFAREIRAILLRPAAGKKGGLP